jgi:membrane protein
MTPIDYAEIALKFLLGLLSMVMVINFTGKGNLAPTSAMEQIMNYVLGGIIGGVIYSRDLHLWQFAIVLFIWFSLVYMLRRLKARSHFMQRILDGNPTVVIVNGEVDVAACKKAKITAHELTFKLRMHNIFNIRKVKRAVVEQNGQLLVVMAGEENLKYPLLTDGSVKTTVLEAIDKDEAWLRTELAKMGYSDPSKLFLVDYLGGQLVVTPNA